MIPASYPARQRNRRLARGVQQALAALALLMLAGAAARVGSASLALALLIFGLALALGCSRSVGLARRYSIGASSEKRVRAELKLLESEGWRVWHSLRWRGGGDIDHIAIRLGTTGPLFAIETKTRTHRPADLARIAAVAQWLSSSHTRLSEPAAIPVLCLAGVRGAERWEDGVAVVSLERLVPLLRRLSGTTRKPRFLR